MSQLGRQILDDVRRFVGGRPQSDDMCLACFGRTLTLIDCVQLCWPVRIAPFAEAAIKETA